ncbi:hypothetical protein ACFWY5_51330 [Nonomuraea sp. NPDC059007]
MRARLADVLSDILWDIGLVMSPYLNADLLDEYRDRVRARQENDNTR